MLSIPSITKKQVVATTGLLLVLFLIFHLAGNLFIYGGPDAFNGYAKKLHSLGPLIWLPRLGLLVVALLHVIFTAAVVLENIKARGGVQRYAVDKPTGKRSWFTRLMPFSGVYIFVFIVWHIMDFTTIDQHGPRSEINGIAHGIYGVVYNSFADPLHSIFYIIAMCFVGMHLAHGVQSYFQTMGIRSKPYVPVITRLANYLAIFITLMFSSIPIFILILSH